MAAKMEVDAPSAESIETPNPDATILKSSVSDELLFAMRDMLNYIYDYRDVEGHDPSKVFHKLVNKRFIPAYYDVIQEPMAMSKLKVKIANKEYKDFSHFVRDCALIWHNAHVYNRPGSGAYVDANTMKGLMESQFKRLVGENLVPVEKTKWPELGEIPPVEDVPGVDDEDEDDDEEEDDEDDEEEDEVKKAGRRGRRPSGVKREDVKEDGTKKRRGRPPKVDTPMDARIKNILKGIRKPRDDNDHMMILHFEKLPDKSAVPEYYHEITTPIAVEQIKRSLKRKRYQSVDHFLRDVDLMFENAKRFNEDDSAVFKAAVTLQKEAHALADFEKQRSDADFAIEDGRKPRPEGLTYRGEIWKVGDWVHIANPNDVTKPIVAQIYRSWEDEEGQEWVNACWYYRPDQTVHQFEKHFYPNEVVKTGQYRDHHIQDVIERCFVMFFTRYNRGRPRGLPEGTEVYVCEARYNEEKHKINKIKTWASCLPDEVRDKDYTMDMFDGIRKVKKIPSPLLHLLKPDAQETDELPTPQRGVDNAPPIVGGIFVGPRDENQQSPPPEPTPSPPPQPAPQRNMPRSPVREIPKMRPSNDVNAAMEQATRAFGVTPSTTPQYSQYGQHARPSHAPSVPTAPQQQLQASTPNMHALNAAGYRSSHTSTTAQAVTPSYQTQQQYSRYSASDQTQPQRTAMHQTSSMVPTSHPKFDVFHLPDQANAAIPAEVRAQFQTDDQGHILFFSKPPLPEVPQPVKPGQAIAHSLRYRANKIRNRVEDERKRKQLEEEKCEGEAKRQKRLQSDAEKTTTWAGQKAMLEKNLAGSLEGWLQDMDAGTDHLWKGLYGESWQQFKAMEMQRLDGLRSEAAGAATARRKAQENWRRETLLAEQHAQKETEVFLDDIDPRY